MPPKTVPTAAEKLETKVYGTQEQQDRKEKVQGQIDSFDKAMDGREYALQGKEFVGDLNAIRKTPINKLSKAGGLFKSGPEANFGEIRSLVQFALARTPKEKYQVALNKRQIYVRCVMINNARANITLTNTHYPTSLGRSSDMSEMGPFRWQDLNPQKKETSFALIGGSSAGSWFRSAMTGGRFIRAGMTFTASSANHRVDFSVGINWDPDKDGSERIGLIIGNNPKGAYEQANKQDAEASANGFMINVMIKGQICAIGIGRMAA